MKVEQLKAELVVFKGLMSNVSSAFLPTPVLCCCWPFRVPVPPLPAPSHPPWALLFPEVFIQETKRLLPCCKGGGSASRLVEAISESRALSSLAAHTVIPALRRWSQNHQKDEGFKFSISYV